jgi:zinc transport system permease protein
MPETSAPATPAASAAAPDEFDALLEVERPAASATAELPASELVVGHDARAPDWSEFRNGWELGIYQDPVLCGVLAGLVLGLLGVFIVLRRAVFVTAAISQSAGLGVALAFLLEIRAGAHVPPVVSAFAMALLAAGLLSVRSERFRLPREALLGFAYVSASAAAVLVGDRISQEAHDVAAILFGTAVLVRPFDLALVAGVGALVVITIACSYRGLVFAGFDPEGARVHGLPVRLIELALWVMVALEVSVTTRAIGALPVFAFAVLPAMAALALVERLRSALVVAALIGGVCGGAGYLMAFFLQFPVGASQAALATAPVLASWMLIKLRAPRSA